MSETKANTTQGVPINDGVRKQAEKEAAAAWNTRPSPTREEIAVIDFDFVWEHDEHSPNPTTYRTSGNGYSAYVLIPYEGDNDPSEGTGTWNGVAQHRGQSGFPSKEAAIEYCQQTIQDFAQVAVNRASNFLTPAPVDGWRDFNDWWSTDGHAIDPEPDVSWYDKRRDFAEMAFNAAMPPSPGEQPATEQPSVAEAALLKRVSAHLALNAHIKGGTSEKVVAHNVGVDSAIAEILSISRGETALRTLQGDG